MGEVIHQGVLINSLIPSSRVLTVPAALTNPRHSIREELADYGGKYHNVIEDEGIDKHIEKLRETNPALADVINGFWEDMKKDPIKYRGLDAMSVIETRIEEIIKNQIDDFAKEWCTQKKDVIAILNTFKKGDSISMTTDYESYSKTHAGVSKLKYVRRAKDAVAALVEKIRPLREK